MNDLTIWCYQCGKAADYVGALGFNEEGSIFYLCWECAQVKAREMGISPEERVPVYQLRQRLVREMLQRVVERRRN